MPTEIKDQSKRQTAIALLQLSIEKNDAAIRATALTLELMRDKQMHRLAELRHQKMLLQWQLDRAAKAATSAAAETTHATATAQ